MQTARRTVQCFDYSAGHAEDNYEIVMSDLGLDEELAAGHLPFAATSGPSLGSPCKTVNTLCTINTAQYLFNLNAMHYVTTY